MNENSTKRELLKLILYINVLLPLLQSVSYEFFNSIMSLFASKSFAGLFFNFYNLQRSA